MTLEQARELADTNKLYVVCLHTKWQGWICWNHTKNPYFPNIEKEITSVKTKNALAKSNDWQVRCINNYNPGNRFPLT